MEEVEIITDKGVCSKVNALIFVLKIALSLKLEFFFQLDTFTQLLLALQQPL
jgi:hypothetical protein